MKQKDEITELLQRLYGFSDDQLLKAFKEAEAEVEAEGGPTPIRKGLNGCGKRCGSRACSPVRRDAFPLKRKDGMPPKIWKLWI